MKFTKRILATLLTLALALTLALPTMAAVDWDEFRITARYLNGTRFSSILIKQGDSFTLSVEVNVPDGIDEVTYQWSWYRDGGSRGTIEGATTSELCLSPSDSYYPEHQYMGADSTSYHCKITAYEKGSLGNDVSSQWLDAPFSVYVERTPLDKIRDITVTPFVYAFGGTVSLISMTMGLLFPVSPLIFLGLLVYGFFEGFRGLF